MIEDDTNNQMWSFFVKSCTAARKAVGDYELFIMLLPNRLCSTVFSNTVKKI